MPTLLLLTTLVCTPTTLATDARALATPLHEHPTLVHMLRENNELRRSMGLRPHRMSPELAKAAQDHANYMARTGNFSHFANGDPWSRAARFGYPGMVRENIAWNYGSVRGVFQGWRASSGHWANIVSSTTEAGFGYAIASDGSTYWVGVYGDAGGALEGRQ